MPIVRAQTLDVQCDFERILKSILTSGWACPRPEK